MTLPIIKGRVAWIFASDNFDVDQIIGVKNVKLTDVEALAALAMAHWEPDFAQNIQAGDVLVGGANFGYGHPHYPPLRAMRHLGIRALIAESFAPGFWRGEISMGFPLIACPGVLSAVSRWDSVSIDWEANQVINITTGATLSFFPFNEADRSTLEQGGLVGYLKHKSKHPHLKR